jgi:MFS family permease
MAPLLDTSRRDYLVMIVTGMATMFLVGISSPIIPLYTKQFTSDLILIGLTVSGYFAVRMFFEIPFGTLSDRMGPRKPLIIGRAISIAGVILSFLASNPVHLILARALWGIGDAAFFCISTAYIASVFPAKSRGRAIGAFISVETIGSFLGQSFAGFAAQAFGYRGIFLVSIPLSLATLPLLLILKGPRNAPSIEATQPPPNRDLRQLLTPTLIGLSILNFTIIFSSNGVTSTILPIYITEHLLISLPEYGLLVAFSTIGSTIGNFSGGWLSDRIGRLRIILLGIIVLGVSSLLLPVATTYLPLAVTMIMHGLAWGTVYSVTPVLIIDAVSPRLRGMAVGMYRTFFDLGGLLGPICISAAASSLGYIPSMYIGAFTVFFSLATLPLIRKTNTRTRPKPE